MAKATTVKEAIAQFEKVKGVVAAEAEKVIASWKSAWFVTAKTGRVLPQFAVQVELLAQVPPIEKLDGALSSLKACR